MKNELKRGKKRERQTCRSTEADGTQVVYMIMISDHLYCISIADESVLYTLTLYLSILEYIAVLD